MSLPLVTRFGADPLLDLEVANKRYVDSSGGGGDKRVILADIGDHVTDTGTSNRFYPIHWWVLSAFVGDTAEANAVITFDWAITLKRIYLRVETNSKNGSTVIGYRDDGVTVASITVAASTTGEFDTGDITVLVDSGSLVNWIMNYTASTSGSWGDFMAQTWGFET